ncbi:MAG TPA: DUF2478 domain-containing protein [Acidobacteria bacterium]|nr:DUF2478 domain-containing protein [Acidobacteriota bacterium]
MRGAGPALLVTAVAAAFLPVPGALPAAVAMAVAGGLVTDREVVRAAFRGGALLGLLFAAAVTAGAVAFSSGSGRGVAAGATLLGRLLVLGIALGVLARRTDAERVLAVARRLGMERTGLVIGLSLNVLPHLLETLRQTWAVLVIRNGGRRPRLRSMAPLPELILAHPARLADEAAAAAALRGHTALGPRRTRLATGARAVVVTGPPGAGKTPAIAAAVRRIRAAGRPVAGFLQPARYEDGAKIGFDIADVVTGERTAFATLAAPGGGEEGTRFRFHREGLELARRSLREIPAGAVVVADELGPVELRGGGHMEAVHRAAAGPNAAALLLVVRRHLIPSLLAALDAQDAVVLDLAREDEPVEAILSALDIRDREVQHGLWNGPGMVHTRE